MLGADGMAVYGDCLVDLPALGHGPTSHRWRRPTVRIFREPGTENLCYVK
jgi:hypothetical protein